MPHYLRARGGAIPAGMTEEMTADVLAVLLEAKVAIMAEVEMVAAKAAGMEAVAMATAVTAGVAMAES